MVRKTLVSKDFSPILLDFFYSSYKVKLTAKRTIFMKLQNILKNIGFSAKEIQIYLSLLSMGESNLQGIVSHAGIPRTTVYIWIKRLIKKGAVDTYKKKATIYYVATQPNKLLDLAEDNVEAFRNNMGLFNHFIGQTKTEFNVKFFDDKGGIQFIFTEILKDKFPLCAITSIDEIERLSEDPFKHFIQRRVKQKLPVRLITNETPEAKKLKEKDEVEFRTTRFVPAKYNFYTANYIFGDKVAIFSLKEDSIMALLIEDKLIAQTQKMLFESLWERIK